MARLLDALGYPTAVEEARRRLAAIGRRDDAGALVAELDGAVAGVAAWSLTHLLERERPSCRLTALAVLPESRRRGLGTLLVEAVEAVAREHGCFRVEVTCRPERRAARALYRRRGFAERPHRFAKQL